MLRGSNYTHKDQIEKEVYGTLLAQNTISVNHDHFLIYHLDLDVDGDANSFSKSNLQTTQVLDHNSPRKSYWKVVRNMAKMESDAKIKVGSSAAELLVVIRTKRQKWEIILATV